MQSKRPGYLYLVDGHALIFRSYFAFLRHPLVNSKGRQTSAVFGFLNTLMALINRNEPRYLGVVFDSPGPTFRHHLYSDYKANRDETPDELVEQMPMVFDALDAMNVARFAAPGYEADDILATFSARFQRQLPVRIVSGDKDLLQVIGERTSVIRPGKRNVLEVEVGPRELFEMMGLEPGQVGDYLALVGDASDNVPGVRGIGPKTAVDLLQRFKTLDGIYERLGELSSSAVRAKLESGRENAGLSRRLVALDSDVPIVAGVDDLRLGDVRTERARELLDEFELGRLTRRLFGRSAAEAPPSSGHEPGDTRVAGVKASATAEDVGARGYRCADSEERLALCARELSRFDEIAVDVETSGLDPMRAVLAGISAATAPGDAWYIPVASSLDSDAGSLVPAGKSPGLPPETVRRHLGALLAADAPAKVGQNIKYDAVVLKRAGMPLGGVSFDTMLASYCLDPSRRSHGLDALAEDVCNHRMIPFRSLFDTRSRVKDIRAVPLDRVVNYACEDADYTLRLKHAFTPMLAASRVESLFKDVEMPLQDVLMRMELTGIRVDAEFLGRLSVELSRRIDRIEGDIHRAVGEPFNLNSTPQLRAVLFEKLGLTPKRKTKTGYSTDVDVLSALAEEHEVPRMLLEYRQLIKLKSTYVDAIPRLVHPETGRVHTSYNQAVASTGRLSSSDPNLQNIPIRTAEGREIRRAFVSRGAGWVLLDADYSQIELRLLAHLSGDSALIEAFRCDEDVHRATAARIMRVPLESVTPEMRSRAKAVNFGIVYGMGARGLAQSIDIPISEAKTFIEDYFRSYPGVRRFIDETIARAREEKMVSTMLGRVRSVSDIDSNNGRARSFAERVAVNTPVQGSAADIIKLAMLDIDNALRDGGFGANMILQVHDELLFDVPEKELDTVREIVKDRMENAMKLCVPLKVDVGTGADWLGAH